MRRIRIHLTYDGGPFHGWQVQPGLPTIQGILALYPTPNGPAVDNATGLYFFPSSSRFTDDSFTIKIDHHINNSNTLSARYAFNRYTDPNG